MGRQIHIQVLQHLGQPDNGLDRWLFDCADAAILEIHDGAWRFTHDKVREELLRPLSALQRVVLHKQAAQAIEQVYGDARAAVLAYHWGQAADLEQEVRYTAMAGEQALKNGSSPEARRLLERALEADKQLAGNNVQAARRARWARWHREAGDSCLWTGDLTASYQHMREALALLGFAEPEGRAAWLLRLLRAVFTQMFHRIFPKQWEGRRPLRSEDLLEASMALSRTADVHWYSHRGLEMITSAFSALNLSEAAGTLSTPLVTAYGNASVVTAYLGLHGLTHVYLRRGLEIGRKLGDSFALSFALTRSALYALGRADWARMNSNCAQAQTLARQIGAERYWRETSSLLCMSLYWQGCFEEALSILEAFERSAERDGDLHYLAVSSVCRTPVLLAKNRIEDAQAVLARAEATIRKMGTFAPVGVVMMKNALLAQVEARQGNFDLALQGVERLNGLGGAVGSNYTVLVILLACIEVLAIVSSAEPTANVPHSSVRQQLAKYSRLTRVYSSHLPLGKPTYARVNGLLEWLSGHPQRALRIWQEGLRSAEKLALPLELGLLEFEIGRHLELTDINRSTHLKRAEAILSEIGATYYVDCAQASKWRSSHSEE